MIVPESTEPQTSTSDPLTIDDILCRIEQEVRRYCVLPSEHAYVAATLWCAATHMSQRWTCLPRLLINAASSGAGKTRAGQVIGSMSYSCPGEMTTPTPAVLFRMVEKSIVEFGKPMTLFLDETQEIWKGVKNGSETQGAVYQILKTGFGADGSVPRCVGQGYDIEFFRVGCMAIIAGIGEMPDEIESRGIVIRIKKRAHDEPIKPLRKWQEDKLRTLGRTFTAVFDAITDDDMPDVPMPVEDRPADVWEPLLTVAELAGGDWSTRAQLACKVMTSEYHDNDDDRSRTVNFLQDIADAFTEYGDEHGNLHKGLLLSYLHLQDDQPWGVANYKYDGYALRRDLRQFSIKAKGSVRMANRPELGVTSGLTTDQFADAFKRYGIKSVASE